MSFAALESEEDGLKTLEKESSSTLSLDPRWQLIERIIRTDPFQKSTRLPGMLLYLARHTINNGDRHKLTEQAIGQAVFGKRNHYNPAEDSTVRVYVRQLRLRLYEYYHSPQVQEEFVVSIPKGGYALEFSPVQLPKAVPKPIPAEPEPVPVPPSRLDARTILAGSSGLLLVVAIFLGLGWYRAATHHSAIPWPVNLVVHKGASTTLVMADAGFALRGLGDKEVSLDSYIDHSYLEPLLPKHMTQNEAGVLHYFDTTRFTSNADAQAAAVLSSLAGPYAENLLLRSARDLNANDLNHGNFIFVGSKASNPWVELFDSRLNFQMVENGPNGSRYVLNRNPQSGEQKIYQGEPVDELVSGDDYGVIALLPPKAGGGSTLVLEGVRMEGTKAAISLLQSPSGRAKLQSKLAALNSGRTPQYFEAVLHAQSVAGATMSVDVIAARILQ